MATGLGRAGRAAFLGSLVVAGPTVAACATGPTYDEWAGTDGAAGRINMDDVQKAFKDSKSATDFEQKVNRIYEGDGLVLIRAKQDGDKLVLEGYEDLNKNSAIDDAQDDLLFTIVKDDDNKHQLRGHGANGYYNSGFGGGNFLFTYLLISSMSPRGYYYNTAPGYARTTIANDRTRYRSSSRYRSQVSRNSRYFNNAPKKFGASKYAAAGKNRGTARQGYMSRQKSTGAFKSSATGVRSSWRSSSSRGGFRGGGRGGFRGGGGGTTIIGPMRG